MSQLENVFPADGRRVSEPPGSVMDDESEARSYQATAAKMWPWLQRPFARRALSYLPRGGSILDLGTGPGLMPCYWAKARPDTRVTGVDLSAAMLTLARSRAGQAGVGERVRFLEADAADTGLPAHSFDVVVSHYALHHFDDPTRLLAEASRLVRPGGTVLVRDLVRPGRLLARASALFGSVVMRNTRDQNRQYTESLAACYTAAEIRGVLERAGLPGYEVRGGPIHVEVLRRPSAEWARA